MVARACCCNLYSELQEVPWLVLRELAPPGRGFKAMRCLPSHETGDERSGVGLQRLHGRVCAEIRPTGPCKRAAVIDTNAVMLKSRMSERVVLY